MHSNYEELLPEQNYRFGAVLKSEKHFFLQPGMLTRFKLHSYIYLKHALRKVFWDKYFARRIFMRWTYIAKALDRIHHIKYRAYVCVEHEFCEPSEIFFSNDPPLHQMFL